MSDTKAAPLQCLHRGRILSCPPTSQTVKEIFLYSTVSTLNPKFGHENPIPLEMSARLPTDCGDGGDDFTQLQLVQNGSFTGGIQANLKS
jgi:hypothetical protein